MLNFLAAIGSAPGSGGGSFESIATATGTGSSNTITFSSIPSTYQHLQIRYIAREGSGTSTTSTGLRLTFNGSATGYAYHNLAGDGASPSAGGFATQTFMLIDDSATGNSVTANIMGFGLIDIHDYASTTKNKTVRAYSGNDRNGAGKIVLNSGFWNNTTAVTSLSIALPSTNFATSSTFALYGIKGA